jgi:HK97 family phage prohead protease
VTSRALGGREGAAVVPAVTLSLPMATLRGAFAPKSLDQTARTVDLVWTTGARVRRYDVWTGETWFEELAVTADAVDLRRLRAGANLLAAHQSYGLDGILGVVESAEIVQGEGYARVRFSQRPKAAEVFRDVKAGIIRNVSVGYVTHEAEELPRKKGEPVVRRATRWEPLELSLVAVGADPDAHVRAAEDAPRYHCILRRRPMFGSVHPSQRRDRPAATDDRDLRRPPPAAVVHAPAPWRSSGSPVRGVGLPSPASTAPAAVARALLHRIDPARYPMTPAAAHWMGMPLTGIVRDLAQAGGVDLRGASFGELAGIGLGLTRPDRVRGDGFLATTDFPAALLGYRLP